MARLIVGMTVTRGSLVISARAKLILMQQIIDELNALADECERLAKPIREEPLKSMVDRFTKALIQVKDAHSGSWLGYHAHLYYRNFVMPPAHDCFDSIYGRASSNWQAKDLHDVFDFMIRTSGNPDKSLLESESQNATAIGQVRYEDLMTILSVVLDVTKSTHIEELRDELRNKVVHFSIEKIADAQCPAGFASADQTAIAQGKVTPPHATLFGWLFQHQLSFQGLEQLSSIARRAAKYLERQEKLHPITSSPERIMVSRTPSSTQTDMTETEIKLRDAATQFDLAMKNIGEGDTFRSCINSFISNTRSVTFVMQKESSDVPGLKEWYEKRMKELAAQTPLLKFFNDKRVHTIHLGTVKPKLNTMKIEGDVNIDGEIVSADRIVGSVWRFEDADPKLFGFGNVPKMCEDYFRIVQHLVKEWLQKKKELESVMK